MLPLPYIGVTCDVESNPLEEKCHYFIKSDYISAVINAGGFPILLPPVNSNKTTSLFNKICKGLIITGGDFDISPGKYGEKTKYEIGKVVPERTNFEIKLLELAAKDNKPVLGICGGEQLMNVFFGGTLYQDINSQVTGSINHDPKNINFTHTISIDTTSKLGKILGVKDIDVNSTHHQAIKDVAPGFIKSSTSEDGIVESIEGESYSFMIGVQFHPEYLVRKNIIFKKLFTSFIEKCYEKNM